MHVISDALKTILNGYENYFLRKIKNARGNWEQNDTGADDYIKNRPFYTDYTENTLLDGTFEFTDNIYQQQNSTIDFEVGKEYTVIFDGVSYNCIAFLANDLPLIGNGAIVDIDSYPNNGEPFLIGALAIEGILVMTTISAGTTHTVTIKSIEENVKTIDKKYLPIIDVAHGGTGRPTIADTEYRTAKYRASSLVSTETNPTDNGVICWVYE